MNKLPRMLQGKNRATSNVLINTIQVRHKVTRNGKKESQNQKAILDIATL